MSKKKSPKAVSIGHAFKDPRVLDISFQSDKTLLGNDVVLLNIDGLGGSYAHTKPWYSGKPNLDQDETARNTEDISRRKTELSTILELGGTIVLFLPPPDSWYFDTGQRQYSGSGRNRQETVLVNSRNLLDLLPFSIETQAAETRDLELKVGEPFATFWRAHGDRFQAACFLKKPFGDTTLVIQGTESAAGAIANIDKGLVIALPQDLLYAEEYLNSEDQKKAYPDDAKLLDSLFDLIHSLRETSGDFEQPEWAVTYLLPAERAEADKVADASKRVAKAQEQLGKAERKLSLLEQRKTLFTGTGPALEQLVEEALEAIGFDIKPGKPGRTDRIATYKGRAAVLEVKGLAKSAGEKDAAQLEKWVSEYHVEHEETPKGLLIVNGWRDLPLDKRTEAVFPDQMLQYSTQRSHCLISGVQLLGMWLEVEAHPERAEAIANELLDCVGVYPKHDDWKQIVSHEVPATEEAKPEADPAETKVS